MSRRRRPAGHRSGERPITAVTRACEAGTTPDLRAEVFTGRSRLRNLGDGYYQANCKTPNAYADSCKTLELHIGDGVLQTAEFRFGR